MRELKKTRRISLESDQVRPIGALVHDHDRLHHTVDFNCRLLSFHDSQAERGEAGSKKKIDLFIC